VKIVDLISKNVLSWKLSNSLVTEFCLKALKMAQGGRRSLKLYTPISTSGSRHLPSNPRLQDEEIKISW
jgi:putative transposase